MKALDDFNVYVTKLLGSASPPFGNGVHQPETIRDFYVMHALRGKMDLLRRNVEHYLHKRKSADMELRIVIYELLKLKEGYETETARLNGKVAYLAGVLSQVRCTTRREIDKALETLDQEGAFGIQPRSTTLSEGEVRVSEPKLRPQSESASPHQ